MDQQTQIIVQMKLEAARLSDGDLLVAKEIYDWLTSETIDSLVKKRLEQLGVEIVDGE